MNDYSDNFKPVSSTEKFNSKEYDILEKNKQFFSHDKKYIDLMLKIISRESDISIRILDWFVTNYSKKHNTYYKLKQNGSESLFYIHSQYKNQLNGYGKSYFDPFCRKRKVIYKYKCAGEDDIKFISSIGQLNFFQWAIRNKVINYVQDNMKKIEIDMKESNRINRLNKLELNTKKEFEKERDNELIDEEENEPDPIICSSKNINSLIISSPSKSITLKSESDKHNKRQQLSKSVYDNGIKNMYSYSFRI